MLVRRAIRTLGPLTPLTVAFVAASTFMATAAVAGTPVPLGTASGFAVLAGGGITNTGATTITGDIGTFPTTAETSTGILTIHGADHRGDSVTQGAKNDLVTAYNAAAGSLPVTTIATELGGQTLLPGVYDSLSGTFGLTGTLTLNGGGDPTAQFVFLTTATLVTASNSSVSLIGSASQCNVNWKVGSSATFGTGTSFVGNVLALTAITATTGATFQGRLLARNAAVTLDNNTITNAACSTTSGSGTSVIGPVINAPAPTPTATPVATATPTKTPKPTASKTPTRAPTKKRAGVAASPGTSGGSGGQLTGGSAQLTSHTPTTHLPFTGLDTAGLLGTGLSLIALGGIAVMAGRRRRHTPGHKFLA